MKLEYFIRTAIRDVREGVENARKEKPHIYFYMPPSIDFDLAIYPSAEGIQVADATSNQPQEYTRMKMKIWTAEYPKGKE
jgi:hypothetical protein